MGFTFKFINISVFVASFVFGLVAVYMTAPRVRTIEVTPSPDNIDKIQYRDQTDHYFEFRETKVACPADAKIDTKSVPHV